MPLTGTKLGQYEVLGPLGAGGMGEVYRARDPILKREVAIKILPSYVAQSADRLHRFEQEAQAAAALNHPNIVAVYQFGEFDAAPYLVTELLEGGTLREQLQHGALPVRKAIDYSVQIGRGLAAAHEKGIVHRDLKPENLFVTRDGRVKILDFGLAKLMPAVAAAATGETTPAGATDPGMVMGTAGYMSPEQVRGVPVDHRTDIFALGAILYEMLSGRRAFVKPTAAETMTAILKEDPPAVSATAAAAAPPGLQRVVHRCLEKNPEQRFQSASDLAFALEALSDSGTSSAIGMAAPEARQARTWLVWVLALVAVLAIAALAYMLVAPQHRGTLRVVTYKQITHDGRSKSLAGTDGSRLYFGELQEIGQVSISGGEIAPIPVNIPEPRLLDVSPDGSTLLVHSFTGGLRNAYPLWTVRTLGGSAHRLGLAIDADFTPDGNSVLYSTENGEIHFVRIDGADDRVLASTGTQNGDPMLSPDGKTIRYVPFAAATTNQPLPPRLWEIATSGGAQPHPMFPNWNVNQVGGRWAPDGRYYLVSDGQIWAIEPHRGIFGRSPSNPVQITSGPIHWDLPVPGRDGRTIYSTGISPRGELVHLDAHSGQFQPFLGGISAEFVSFSRNGKSVAWVSYPDGILFQANADGSNRMQLTDGSMYPRVVEMSPDGSQVLFEAPDPKTRNVRVWIVSSEGGAPRLLLPDAKGPEEDGHWSPDARQVVFASSPEGGGDPHSEIRILNFDTNQVTIVPGSTGMFSPHWSPNGRYLVALPTTSLGLNIFDFKTQRWSAIYHHIAGFDTWSADSQWVYFIDFQDHPGIYRIRITGGEPQRVVDFKGSSITGYFGIWTGLDPNDAPMLLRDIGSDDIYALTLARQ